MMDTSMCDVRKLVVLSLMLLPLLLVGCSLSLESSGNDAPTYRGPDPLSDTEGDSDGSLEADDDDDDAGDDDDDAGDDDDLAGGSSGTASVISLEPAPDSIGHHYRHPITVTFDVDGSSAMFRVEGPGTDGVHQDLPLLPAQWNGDGTVVAVYPADFLRSDSEYRVSIEQNDSVLEYSFTTSTIGAPLDQAVQLEGRTYSISPSQGTVVSPPALAPLLAGMSADFSWLWQFHSDQHQEQLSVDTGAGAFDASVLVQDSCTPTASLLSQDSLLSLDDAYFSGATDEASFWLGGAHLELENVEVDGDFRADASSIEEVHLSGWLDSAGLSSLISLDSSSTGTASMPCDWVQQQLGVSCQNCPSGSGDCVWIDITSLSGSLQSQPLQDIEPLAAAPCTGEDAFASAVSCAISPSRLRPGPAWLLLSIAFLLRRRR